ncbi:MAG: recombinase RecT [Cyanothece sp. SIO1E1]|nr:recombinase RecT [Cyanothece sp. SIO1E1]
MKDQFELEQVLHSERTKLEFIRILGEATHFFIDDAIHTIEANGFYNCTKDSILNVLYDIAVTGFFPSNRNRLHLFEEKGKLNLIIDYKGLADMVIRTGLFSTYNVQLVYDYELNEHKRYGVPFERDKSNGIKKHIWVPMKQEHRKDEHILAAYCQFYPKGADKPYTEFMERNELDMIKREFAMKHSSKFADDNFPEWCKKTVVRKAANALPLSDTINDVLLRQQELDYGMQVNLHSEISGPSEQRELIVTNSKERISRERKERNINKVMNTFDKLT